MKLDDYQDESDDASRYLFIGPQGTGKSIAAASFPKVKIFDIEGKLLSLKNWYNKPQYLHLKENIYDIELITDIEKFIDDTLYSYVQMDRLPFQSIMVDGIQELSREIVNKILFGRKKAPVQDGKVGGDRAKVIHGTNVILPSWDEFDAEDVILGGMLGYLTAINKRHGINIICLAHPVTTQGPNGQSKTARIVCKGHKAPQTVVNAFNEIYHFEKVRDGVNVTDPVKYIALTKSGDFSRTANDFLPNKIDFTDKIFYEVLKELLDKKGVKNERIVEERKPQKL